jgi:hypothetical protein
VHNNRSASRYDWGCRDTGRAKGREIGMCVISGRYELGTVVYRIFVFDLDVDFLFNVMIGLWIRVTFRTRCLLADYISSIRYHSPGINVLVFRWCVAGRIHNPSAFARCLAPRRQILDGTCVVGTKRRWCLRGLLFSGLLTHHGYFAIP